MKAAVLHKPGELLVEEVPKPDPGPEDIVVKVAACGLCGTDLKLYKGEYTGNTPVIIGHEMTGEVVEMGEKVAGLSLGDRVVVDPNESCGACAWCRAGCPTHCSDMAAYGVLRDGGFAEFCVVGAKGAYPVPAGLSERAAAFAEPVSCAVHCIDLAGAKLGQTVVIIGGGPMGQILVQLAKNAGAARVILVSRSKWKLDLALARGANDVVSAACQDPVVAILEMTNGLGSDVVIEAVGSPETIEQSLQMARKAGTVVIFGLAPESCEAKFAPFDILTKELTIVGAWLNPYTFPRALQALAARQVEVESLIAAEVSLDEVNQTLQRLQDKPAGFMKVLVTP